jgi:hypothetical protein
MELLSTRQLQKDEQSKAARLQALREYLVYRTENDPAQRLLNSAFGATWTDTALRTVMFPTDFVVEKLDQIN